tara:strand:+ start:1344 stop:2144 length:801 start_codon:yes stop_codon:yes gene_type:complete
MKKYLVIGNPIDHSLSPKLHNYWIKKNNIDAIYEKKKINETDIEFIISEIKNDKINGINVTVPFKKSVIPFIDDLSFEAKETQSVNTIHKENQRIVGHNTDIFGFVSAIKHNKISLNGKKVCILGAGGVVPSIIVAFKKMSVSKIIISNRTKQKAEELKNNFKELEVVNWKDIPTDVDVIVNATSIGLNKDEDIKLKYTELGSKKLFYDVIYNPSQTNFLKNAKAYGNYIDNGKMMFIYQAKESFKIWHNINPKIDENTLELLNNI